MILYHFCPVHMVESIRKNGLTLGKVPVMGDGHYSFIDNCQWLTNDKDPKKQSWATSQLIPYSRTAYRLTIEIPASRRKRLVRAIDFVKVLPEDAREVVTAWPGHEHWYIFRGRIPPAWIVGCREMKGASA